MNTIAPSATEPTEPAASDAPPACVMSFNASDPSGAGGLAGDISTIAAMGAHALPVVTAIVMRDTAEVFESHEIEADTIVEQARSILEDVTISAWKVGFLGSAEGVAGVAEVLSDYPDVPLVAYLTSVSWLEEDDQQAYQDAYRELILPATEVLVGNQQTLVDFLLPEWEAERPPSARELAVAAGELGARYVLVTGIALPASRGAEAQVDNVLASPQGAITGEKFERFDATFLGAGETLAAALASLLASGQDLHLAVSEALSFLDQALDAGFRPGMGNVVPDRFFWALPEAEPGAEEEGLMGEPTTDELPSAERGPRRIH
ncbi:hydroxymethylpyrimidine/phosphomethylpyrimidine kinase [Methylibium sp. Pch-M]|uniref:bifunctional hydroxymethylpyrimidine kinase/phosphomethylpyrimidine kinase n=1 Tax=Methylibium sp. Pch-M TaxID=2082386 RepID=UPI0010112384|nr:bifunctional hydroxymethylpyrimidine kinase/phosphomethylpyrimidine kinase [Methylibium sp. Pch-M]QAZ38944.1 hydroxymethylpyrimidine/phosphomethylpyrimidine kinase [Methylibium sp. Pch-M]